MDLRRLSLCDVVSCNKHLREISKGADCLEDVAQSISEYFYDTFRDRKSGVRQVALARFFKSHPYHKLPEELQVEARNAMPGVELPQALDCLTLLGTAGVEPEWNSRLTSRHHKVLPLHGEERPERTPMIAALFDGLGWQAPRRGLKNSDRTCNVFLIRDAVGHDAFLDQASFVKPYGLKSVISFGGMLDGQLFCVVLFTSVLVGKRTAELFRSVGLCTQLGLTPLWTTVFRGQSSTASQDLPGLAPDQLSELLDIYEQNIQTQARVELSLESALEVIPDSFFRFKSDGTILDYRNQEVLGSSALDVPLVGRRVQDLLAPDLAARFEAALAEASKRQGVVPLVYSLELCGEMRSFEARFVALREKDQFVTVIRDVTSRLRADNLLLFQSRRLEAIASLRKVAPGESEETLVLRGLRIIEAVTEDLPASLRFPGRDSRSLEYERPVHEEALVEAFQSLLSGVSVSDSTSVILEILSDRSNYSEPVRKTIRILTDELLRVVKQQRSSAEITKLAQALEQCPLGVVITNTKPEIEYVNKAFLDVTGYALEEVIGQNPSLLNSGKTPPETYRNLWSKLLRGQTWKGEFHNRRKDGSLYPEFAIVGPVVSPEGTVTHYVAVKEDITEKKRLGQELDEHRNHLESLVQTRTAALAEKSAALELAAQFDRCESRILAGFNARDSLKEMLERMLVALAEDLRLSPSYLHLANHHTGVLKLFSRHGVVERPDPNLELPKELVDKVVKQKRPVYLNLESRLGSSVVAQFCCLKDECKGVSVIPLACKVEFLGILTVAVWWGPDDPRATLLRQLTDQVAIAIQSQIQYERMEAMSARLNEREQRIARQNAALERANRLKSEFLANMSHELRTPLNAIIGFSEVMVDGLVGDLNDQQADYAKEIVSAGHYLLSLINDILDLSKVEAGRMSVQYGSIEPHSVCKAALSIVRERAKVRQTDLKLDFDDRLEPFLADERMFKQMLYNLLSNAVKFTREGQVTLRARLEEDPNLAVFAVEDTGIGISKDDLQNLFKPFQQVDGSASRQFEGTGLGLALCKSLVELHSGFMRVESEPGVGSLFEISLPYIRDIKQLAEKNASPDQNGVVEVSTDLHAPLAMIIEDEDPAAELLSLYLTKANWRVVRARSLSEGRALLSEVEPNLILLDLLLPTFDGWSLLEEIKSNPKTSHLPVVVISIVADENRLKAKALGAAAVLQKPVSQSILLACVEELSL